MNKIITSFAAALIMTLAVSSYSDAVQSDLQSNLIRLHIIADSDSEADQTVKLKVRDAVLNELGAKFSGGNIDAFRDDITGNLGDIEKIADRVLAENGFTYRSSASYGKYEFPRKKYSSVTLPAGEYYGVRVVLGSGKGHNWWCVMYPPMCFTENDGGELSESGKNKLRKSLGSETYDIVTGNGNDVVVKFKLVEVAEEIKQKVAH